jgi:hypothetical protein
LGANLLIEEFEVSSSAAREEKRRAIQTNCRRHLDDSKRNHQRIRLGRLALMLILLSRDVVEIVAVKALWSYKDPQLSMRRPPLIQ